MNEADRPASRADGKPSVRAAAAISRHVANLGSPEKRVAFRAERTLLRFYLDRARPFLEPACDSPNYPTRFRAAWILGHTRDAASLPTILRLTDDENEQVRYDATLALGVLGDTRAIEPLIRILLSEDETRPAADALARLGTTISPRLAALLPTSSVWVRHCLTCVLGGFAEENGDAASIEALKQLVNDPDKYVQSDARYFLAQCGEGTAE